MGLIFGKQRHTVGVKKTEVRLAVKNKNVAVTSKDKAILDLKNARDRLKKYKKRLESESDKLYNQAKILAKSNHDKRALLVLKLRKHKIAAADNIDSQLISVFQMIEDIEWESTNIQVMEALRSGTKSLNELHEEMSADDVEAILSDTNDAIDVENQINSLLADQGRLLDDTELEAELNSLLQSSTHPLGVNLPEAPSHTIVNLPEAPKSDLSAEVISEQKNKILV